MRVQEGVCVWGCMSGTGGTGNLYILPPRTMMRKEQYLEVLEQEILPTMDEHGCTELVEDNATCHKAIVCKKFKLKKKIRAVDWPANSPDLNVIENLWAYLKRQIRQKNCLSRDVLIEAIREAWGSVTLELCQSLASSMPRRIAACRAARGGVTKY